MTYYGLVCVMLCSLTLVLLAAVLPYVAYDLREAKRGQIPVWLTVAAVVLMLGAVLGLRFRTQVFAPEVVMRAVLLSALTLGGVFAKWAIDLAARKPWSLHQLTLAKSLLVAPLLPFVWSSVFVASAITPRLGLLWFFNGFICHTLIGDLERLREKERVIVRRLEPPYEAAPPGEPTPIESTASTPRATAESTSISPDHNRTSLLGSLRTSGL